MNLETQRRRFIASMTVTVFGLIVAMIAAVAFFAFHASWAMWVFAAAILAGFASHIWLMLGVLRDRPS